MAEEDTTVTEAIGARLTPEELSGILAECKRMGKMPISAFVRMACSEKVEALKRGRGEDG